MYNSKKLLPWLNCGPVALYKKFVLINVKFDHIIKLYKIPELFPNRKFRIVRSKQLSTTVRIQDIKPYFKCATKTMLSMLYDIIVKNLAVYNAF